MGARDRDRYKGARDRDRYKGALYGGKGQGQI